MLMPVMRMLMPSTPRRDPQALIHGHKRHEADQDGQPEDQVPVRLHQHEARPVGLVLADEDLGQQVEEGVAEEAADGEGDHDGERGRVDVCGDEGEEEVGRAGDVERGEEGVCRGGAGEEDGEEGRREGGGGGFEVGEFGGVELLDDGACLWKVKS